MVLTPLHNAVTRDDLEEVIALLHSGADPNAGNHRKRTPLHDAVLLRRMSIIPILLQYGADPKLQDASGEDAFGMAGRRDDVDGTCVLAREHKHKFV